MTVDRAWVATLAAQLPELPTTKRDRYEQQWGVRRIDAEILTSESLVANYFEQAVAERAEKLFVKRRFAGQGAAAPPEAVFQALQPQDRAGVTVGADGRG